MSSCRPMKYFQIAMQAVTAERHVLAATAVPLLKKLMGMQASFYLYYILYVSKYSFQPKLCATPPSESCSIDR